MAFRYLIYRTDFGNTIVAESATAITGGTTGSTFTDFVIPEIQPLYLWRVTGGTAVVPNTDQNINGWLDNEYPPSPDDAITYNIFTGYTAQTQTDIDNKINIVTGATGNLGEFDVSGNLIDTGFSIADITGLTGNDRYVSGMTYIGSTLTLQRTEGLPDLTVTIVSTGNTDGVVSGGTLSGTILSLQRTEGLPDVNIELSGLTSGLEGDILTISGDVIQNAADIQLVSGVTTQNASDIQLVSGVTTQNASDIAYISGVTAGKQDALTAGGGISVADLANDIIAIDLSAYTAPANVAITLTGGSFIVTDNNPTPLGIQYAANYAATFVDRSLVDKAYVDSIASGLDPKNSVNVSTTSVDGNIDLTGGTFSGGSTLDGIVVQDGWRVLVKNQTLPAENGIYDYSASTSGFTRSSDFDGTPSSEVTSGAFTTVISGLTLNATSWVVTTPDPIIVGTTPINWTLLSKPVNYIGGVGITVSGTTIIFDGASVAGNSLLWSGNTLNVDITSGTLATALAGKLDVSVFNSYTGSTETRLQTIEGDILTISGDVIQNTQNIASLSGSSISIDAFTGYTATTDTRITGIENDISFLSGATDDNSADIAYISGVTDTKLDTSIFTGYTATTVANELFLVHTGGTELNEIIPVAIVWHTGVIVDSSYSFTGSTIEILEAGDYQLTYNIPYNQIGSGQVGIGGNLILNNTDVIDITSTGSFTNNAGQAGSNGLPSVNLTFAANDKIDLVEFRTAKSGSGVSSPNGTILIKKNNTLQ